MKRIRYRVCALVISTLAGPSAFASPVAIEPPPLFPPGDVVDIFHGVAVADPYRALEDGTDPKVQAWSDAQNARTRDYLGGLPGRAGVEAQLRRLTMSASPSYSAVQAQGPFVFALYNDPSRQQPSLVRLNKVADPSSRQSVLDPNVLDATGHTEIDWYVPSPDGTKVAVSLSRNGSEDGTLYVFDVKTGRKIVSPIPQVQFATGGGSVAWTADSKAFWYTRYPVSGPEAEKHFNQQAYFHQIGTPVADDPLVLGAADGVPRIGEINLHNEQGSGVALAAVQLGDSGQWQVFLLQPGARARQVAGYSDKIIAAALSHDGTLYGVSRLNAPRGKVLRLTPPYIGGFDRAEVLTPEQNDAAIIDVGRSGPPIVVAGDQVVVNRINGGPSRLSIYSDTGTERRLALPHIAAASNVVALPNGDVLYGVSTYLEPTYYMRWNHSTGRSARTRLAVKSPISFGDVTVSRAFATSKDGTRVPLNIIAKRDIKLSGSNPVVLYGYGGFAANTTPRFVGALWRLWLDAGGVYVEANIRGGGEYGSDWHLDGTLTKKQNVFDDFAAAANWLVTAKYTSHDELALMGASNGGTLMGAQITQHPEIARAVVALVGVYDMIRFELDPNGAFNIGELGTVKDPAQFAALYAYSPYHRVKKNTAYPAVLMLTGANDGRVNPLNSRKFAASLQAATSSEKPILLRTSEKSGHGIGSSLDDLIAERTDILMFLFDQLDVNARGMPVHRE